VAGLKAGQIRRIQQLYRRKVPIDRVLTHELARHLCEISRETNRQIGVLISRKGEIHFVVVGDHRQIMIPSLDEFRSGESRLKGLRLVHTHLNGEALSRDDLTDLALLRLDFICAVAAEESGLSGNVHSAHLIPENPDGRYWLELDALHPARMDLDFAGFIQDLEDQITRRQRTRRVSSRERAILIRVETDPRNRQNTLGELKELAESCGVEVFDAITQHRQEVDPKYLMGKGKLSDVVIRALQIGANLLIFDHELTPAQVRSITDFTELKVIDRTQVILDIFAQRAHSRDGKIQVELAQLKYMLPRLIEKNTAMSRLTGGIGGTGPGETKLEINRRRVRDKIHRLEADLKNIQKGRNTRRAGRERAGLPVVSIVGYTNAGKSTLLNALTNSNVLVEDRLFATLDPKSSRLRFPRDTEAVITDTVGFIRNLPKELFAAFRATLEELHEADVLLHLIDVSSADFEDHIVAVEKILEELGIAAKPTIRVFNKEDRVADKELLTALCRRFEAVAISALDPSTFQVLLDKVEWLIHDGKARARGSGGTDTPDAENETATRAV
jgi:GTP-binding protein HflX